jgi:hypothetical protein
MQMSWQKYKRGWERCRVTKVGFFATVGAENATVFVAYFRGAFCKLRG